MTDHVRPLLGAATVAVSLILGACVVTPPDTSLEEARAAVRRAEANPDVVRFDGVDLATAQKQLANAENAAANDARNLEDHEAYLAVRSARLAEVRADEIVSQARIAAADGDRARVELAARTLDAQRARDSALMANAQTDALQAQLNGIGMQHTPRGAMLVLTDDYFEPGRAELTPGAAKILDGVAQFMLAHPERRVRVEGHADSSDSANSRLTLSLHRAETVRMAIVARGVDPLRSEAVGYGPENPLVSSDNPADRHFIRGVDILLSDSTGQIASR